MAEIIQHETQEAQALKSKGSPYTAKAHAPQPLREAGYNKRLEADMYGKVGGAVDRVGRVVKAYSDAKDVTLARKTMKLMDFDHAQTMLDLSEHLNQTDLENLDLKDTVARWEFRHDKDSEGFKIGKSDSKGKPTHKVFSKRLEDYNIPRSQKDALEKHYNGLEKQKTDYLVSTLPEILIGKAKFQLNQTTQELKNNTAAIFQLQDNYAVELPEGYLDLYDADSKRDLSDEEVAEIEAARDQALSEPTKYTLNLTNDANSQLLDLFEEYDKNLLELMHTGVLSAEEAIAHQRVFTQDVLKQQFDADVSRDEDGAYLKLGNKGYYIDRNLLRGHSFSEKLQQKMHIDEKSTSQFVTNYNSNKQKEDDKALKVAKKNEIKSRAESITREVQKEDSYDNMTYDEIVQMYKDAEVDEYIAKQHANVWEANKAAHDAGLTNDDVTLQLNNLAADIMNDSKKFKSLFSYTTSDGEVFVKEGKQLKDALIESAESRLRQKKYDTLSPSERGPGGAANVKLTKEEKARIATTAGKVKPGSIQKMLNTKEAHTKERRKSFLIGAIERQAGTAFGRADIKERYLIWDADREMYAPDQEKIEAVYKNSGFESNIEMGDYLNNIAKMINTEDEAERKRISKIKNVSTSFMTDGMFKKAMWADAKVKEEMIANIATGAQDGTVFSAFTEDPSKSYFNVEAESYLKTANGQKDKNFHARYHSGEGGGINIEGVLTPTQIHYKNQMNQAFIQLYGIELDLLPKANTKIEVLQGYYDELLKNKSGMQVKNAYTKKLAHSIETRLNARIQQLQKHAIGGTMTRDCWKDGKHDDACTAAFKKAHPVVTKTHTTINNATMPILLQTLGIGTMSDPDQGVKMEMEQK